MSEDNPLNITCWEDAGSWESCDAMLLSPIRPRLEAIRLAIRERLLYYGMDTSAVDAPIQLLDSLSDALGRLSSAHAAIPLSMFVCNPSRIISCMTVSFPGKGIYLYDQMEFNNVSAESAVINQDDFRFSFQDGAFSIQMFIPLFRGAQTFRIYFSTTHPLTGDYPEDVPLYSLGEWIWFMYQRLIRQSMPNLNIQMGFHCRDKNSVSRVCRQYISSDGSSCSYSRTIGGRRVQTSCSKADLPSLPELWNMTEWIDDTLMNNAAGFRRRSDSNGVENMFFRQKKNIEYQAYAYFLRRFTPSYGNDVTEYHPVTAAVDAYCTKAQSTENFYPELCRENNTWLRAGEFTEVTDHNEWLPCPAFPQPETPPSILNAGWEIPQYRGELKLTIPKADLFPFVF